MKKEAWTEEAPTVRVLRHETMKELVKRERAQKEVTSCVAA